MSPSRRAQEAIANARALSGDRFVAGGEEFQLADVIAPPLYRLEKDTPAYFEASRRALENILSTGVSVEDAGKDPVGRAPCQSGCT